MDKNRNLIIFMWAYGIYLKQYLLFSNISFFKILSIHDIQFGISFNYISILLSVNCYRFFLVKIYKTMQASDQNLQGKHNIFIILKQYNERRIQLLIKYIFKKNFICGFIISLLISFIKSDFFMYRNKNNYFFSF